MRNVCVIVERLQKQELLLGMKSHSGYRRLLYCFPLLFLLPLLFTVLELQHYSVVEAPSKKHNNKFDHLVLGSAAGQGLPNRLQCRGTKALTRIDLPTASKTSDVGDSVTFVTVFTIYNASAEDSRSVRRFTVGNSSYTKTESSMAILNIFISFIQVTMPRSSVNILTDPASGFSLRRNGVTVYPIEGEYSRDRLMLQRIQSYVTFLDLKLKELNQQVGLVSHYIFTDSDMAVVGDLGHIFHKYPDFHLALTFRNNKDQPLNSGFIAVRGTSDAILRAKDFLEKVLKAYSSKFMSSSRMLGDQLALAWVVKSSPGFDPKRFTKPQIFQEEIDGASVLFLPCASYNWTPPEGAGQFHGMPLDVQVVHFKGSRKRLMLESWNFFNSTSDISDTLCLILISGRTKYDF